MEATMELKRRLARALAVFCVAIAAGHVVQALSEPRLEPAASLEGRLSTPERIQTVSAGPEALREAVEPAPAPAAAAPVTAASTLPVTLPELRVLPLPTIVLERAVGGADAPSGADLPVVVERTDDRTIVPDAMQPALTGAEVCATSLELAPSSDAMLAVRLAAPCTANARVVLAHAGLVITAVTSPEGLVDVVIPALDPAGEVTLRLPDGTEVTAAQAMPDVASLRRVALQWQDGDAFSLNAFEGGVGYDVPGHVSAARPGRPDDSGAGYLTLLGDPVAAPALLAEVYTFPKDSTAAVEVSVEAEVTALSCGRDALAQLVTVGTASDGIADIVLSMPDCGSVGDRLVMAIDRQNAQVAAAN
jgi:hypothetical protein